MRKKRKKKFGKKIIKCIQRDEKTNFPNIIIVGSDAKRSLEKDYGLKFERVQDKLGTYWKWDRTSNKFIDNIS